MKESPPVPDGSNEDNSKDPAGTGGFSLIH
jgi:hypothetical protein